MFNYDRDEVKSIRDLPNFKLAYSDLCEELGFNVEFPVKEVTADQFWTKFYIIDVGPSDPKHPIMMYRDKLRNGSEKLAYYINKTTLKAMMRTDKTNHAIYLKVKWFFNLLNTYRREREDVDSRYYDDMEIMFGMSHLEKKHHISKTVDLDEAVFKEFDEEYVARGQRGKMKSEHVWNVVVLDDENEKHRNTKMQIALEAIHGDNTLYVTKETKESDYLLLHDGKEANVMEDEEISHLIHYVFWRRRGRLVIIQDENKVRVFHSFLSVSLEFHNFPRELGLIQEMEFLKLLAIME
ncbi:hypothetical protein IWW37_004581 [Coemansia sp. RSA 2050]|nr:hypothetical protein IWW37_004581 [Coemansia sp. RSA 2050]